MLKMSQRQKGVIELFIGCSLLLQVEITEQSINDYFMCNQAYKMLNNGITGTEQYFKDRYFVCISCNVL